MTAAVGVALIVAVPVIFLPAALLWYFRVTEKS